MPVALPEARARREKAGLDLRIERPEMIVAAGELAQQPGRGVEVAAMVARLIAGAADEDDVADAGAMGPQRLEVLFHPGDQDRPRPPGRVLGAESRPSTTFRFDSPARPAGTIPVGSRPSRFR